MLNYHLGAGQMQVGIRRLLDHHPLLGGMVASWHIRPGQIGTMSVSWGGSGIVLTYDPDFVMALTLPQLEDVLIHEVRHVIYGHCFMAPEDWPDREALVIAQEVTVNEGLVNLPGNPVVLEDYPQLQTNTDTHERYDVLSAEQQRDTENDRDLAGEERDPLDEGNRAESENANSSAKPRGNAEPGDGHGGEVPQGEGKKSGSAGKKRGSGGTSADNHTGWESMRDHRDEVNADIRTILRELAQSNRSLQEDVPELKRMEESVGRMPFGLSPNGRLGAIDSQPREVSPHQLRQTLMRMMGSGRDRSARFDRPPRRCPDLIGVIPALARCRMRVRALAVIDTSGSIDAQSLASMAAILRMIEDTAEFTVVECDAAIHRVYPFLGALRATMGGGGTDFRPPLESAFLARTGAEAVVYFTDGYGQVPESAPQVPVIWALTHNGEPPCTWGQVLRIEVI